MPILPHSRETLDLSLLPLFDRDLEHLLNGITDFILTSKIKKKQRKTSNLDALLSWGSTRRCK